MRYNAFTAAYACRKDPPKGKRVIMDDGPPHGPGTADPSSAVQAGSCASEPGRSAAASSVVAKDPFSWRKKKQTRILQIMAGIISSSSSSSCCGRRSLLRGVGQRDAFISYLFGLERFTSAAALPPLHALRPRCGDAPPCGAETEPTASCSQHHIHDISAGSELFSKNFFLKPGLVVGVHIDRAQRQNN